jgi:signal transduction histidine kinase
MVRKHFCGLIILLHICTVLSGQNPRIDSLYRAEATAPDAKTRFQIQHQIVSVTWDFDLEKANDVASLEYKLAQQLDDPQSLLIALTDLGMYHYFVGNYDEAGRLYRQALAASQGKQFGDYPAYTYTRLGNLHRVQARFDSARFYYAKTLTSLKDVPPGVAEGSVYFHMGWLEYDLSRYARALPYLYRSLHIRYKLGDSLLIAECKRVIGTVHLGLNDYDSALYYLKDVLRIGTAEGDNELIILASIDLGDFHVARGDLLEAIQEYQEALVLLQNHEFKRYKALVLHHIGLVFDSQENYLKAIEYLLNALKLSEELNSRQEMAKINVAIGWSYNDLHNYDQGFAFARRAMKLAREIKDTATIAFTQNLLGNLCYNTKQNDLALSYYDSALTYRTDLGLTLLTLNTMYNISMLYQNAGRYREALDYLYRYSSASDKTSNLRGQANANNAIGLVLARLGNYKEAEAFISRGLALATKVGSATNKRESYNNFAKTYTLAGQHKKANDYYEKYIAINDSIINRENQLSSLQMGALYQLDVKEQELEKLADDNALKQVRINAQQSDLTLKNSVIFFTVIVIVLLFVASFVLYRYYREKSESHKALEALNREISEQREEIQSQSEELIEANESLSKLNYDLLEKQEEIEAQSEELREANETIGEINVGLESVIAKRTGQLQEAYKELDTFFYRSSHDFRRPLTTFLGLAEVAKITVKDANALELFEKVKETATNLDKMLFKLQSISDVGTQQLVYKEVFIKEIFNNIHDAFRDEMTRVAMKASCEIELEHVFYSYPAMVKIIVENLIENAYQFRRPDGPAVVFRVFEKDRHIVLEVKDNGQGIDPQYHEQIFDMYFRGNERSRGNGLGLYIVKKAVEKLGGSVTVQSAVAEGSTFTVYLPLEGSLRIN